MAERKEIVTKKTQTYFPSQGKVLVTTMAPTAQSIPSS
jgi:hypothetical protein